MGCAGPRVDREATRQVQSGCHPDTLSTGSYNEPVVLQNVSAGDNSLDSG
jgi:hypothetical protein